MALQLRERKSPFIHVNDTTRPGLVCAATGPGSSATSSRSRTQIVPRSSLSSTRLPSLQSCCDTRILVIGTGVFREEKLAEILDSEGAPCYPTCVGD